MLEELGSCRFQPKHLVEGALRVLVSSLQGLLSIRGFAKFQGSDFEVVLLLLSSC